jgi:NAD(P)-dependent dehydrogenase (short-subunit alcohol dehydrogenase family)
MANTYLITGGSRGIGAAVAKLAASKGHDVCINYMSNSDAAEQVVADCKAHGVNAIAVQGDMGNEADILRMFEAVDQMGPLAGLVNNAGHVGQSDRVENITAERLNRMFAVHLTGSFLCAREAIKRMSTEHGGKGGAIVNLSSAAAYLGSPNMYVDYAAAKAGVDIFTKGLALEVAGEGIRVNAIRPGLIDTEIHASGGELNRVERLGHTVPMGRAGTAEEVAQAIVWLLSEDASYVTGDCLNVGGGR